MIVRKLVGSMNGLYRREDELKPKATRHNQRSKKQQEAYLQVQSVMRRMNVRLREFRSSC